MSEELRDSEFAAAYLTAALESGSPDAVLLALRGVADAHGGIAAAAEAAQLNRQTPYCTLSNGGNPTVVTLLRLLRAVGLNLAVTPTVSA